MSGSVAITDIVNRGVRDVKCPCQSAKSDRRSAEPRSAGGRPGRGSSATRPGSAVPRRRARSWSPGYHRPPVTTLSPREPTRLHVSIVPSLRPLRRFAGILAVVLLIGVTQACGPSEVPLDTLANDSSQAENLAYSVAINAGCGSFEDLDPAGTQGTWHFTCQRGATSFDIGVFGGDDSRRSGLKSLQDAGHPFLAKGYYAVTVVPSGSSKEEALGASPSPSLLDPFK